MERDAHNIQVTMTSSLLTGAIQFNYVPETPHLKVYFELFNKLQNKLMLRSLCKGFLLGLPAGIINICGFLLKKNHKEEVFTSSMIAGLMLSIYSVFNENKFYGKHPCFDNFLNKYDNYFDNFSLQVLPRIFLAYIGFVIGNIMSTGVSVVVVVNASKG